MTTSLFRTPRRRARVLAGGGLEANAACPTQPATSSRDAFRRKTRHLTTAPHYRRRARWTLATDALLDPLVAAMAVAGAAGLVHIGGWIPLVAAGLALTVRSATLSSFARDLDQPASIALRAFGLGPLRWALLGLATLSTFTSSPTWTQRAPTNRLHRPPLRQAYDYGSTRRA